MWILLLWYIADANTGTCRGRYEIRSKSSSILDHFPDIGWSNVEWIQSKRKCASLTYTSEHSLYICILLLQYSGNASVGICHYRDKIRPRLRLSSILDHFPNIRRSNVEQFQLKHRLIFINDTLRTFTLYVDTTFVIYCRC